MALTRTDGPHSIASDLVSESRPALAAPYAAVPGDGRIAETDDTFTIDPPSGWACMIRFAAWARRSGPIRLSETTRSWKRGEASAAAASGAPPALLTAMSSRPQRSA